MCLINKMKSILANRRVTTVRLVVVIISGLRYDHLAAYGNSWLRLPHFNSLTNSSMVFDGLDVSYPDDLSVRFEMFTGLSSNRFTKLPVDIYRKQFTLFSILSEAGISTAIFSDNVRMELMYNKHISADYVYFVPSWLGESGILNGGIELVTGRVEKSISDELVGRYLKYRAEFLEQGYSVEQLVSRAEKWVDNVKDRDFLLFIDSNGFNPPWDLPGSVIRYRRESDIDKLAWPIWGPVDMTNSEQREQINFLRRTYADMCIFYDDTIGKFLAGIIDQNVEVIFLSDFGLLIGDGDYLGINPDIESDVIRRGVCMYHLSDKGSERRGKSIKPVDLFTTIISRFNVDIPIGVDGRNIFDDG